MIEKEGLEKTKTGGIRLLRLERNKLTLSSSSPLREVSYFAFPTAPFLLRLNNFFTVWTRTPDLDASCSPPIEGKGNFYQSILSIQTNCCYWATNISSQWLWSNQRWVGLILKPVVKTAHRWLCCITILNLFSLPLNNLGLSTWHEYDVLQVLKHVMCLQEQFKGM